jgi:serine phosphatase RsbU (regulator of sigma subunit)
MKIRTQLVLACFVLSVLPLSGIVLYSYQSSRRALESAYQQEAQRLTRQMDRRLTSIRAELDERLASLSDISIKGMPDDDPNDPGRNAIIDNIMMAVGDAAPLIDALRFIPTTVAPAAATRQHVLAVPSIAEAPAPPGPPSEAEIEEPEEPEEVAELEELEPLIEPIVIDLPPTMLPRFEMTAEAHAAIAEIARLSKELEEGAGKMERHELDAKKKTIRERQETVERELDGSRAKFQKEMEVARKQADDRRRIREAARAQRRVTEAARAVAASRPVQRAQERRARVVAETPRAARKTVKVESTLSQSERDRLVRRDKQSALIFGRKFNIPVQSESGKVVGQLQATLATDEVIRRVLGGSSDDRDEIPFAIDREGNVYTRGKSERETLDRLGIPERVKKGRSLRNIPDWIVVLTRDEESGLRVGVARPVGGNLVELRQTAARNFGYGVGLIAFALIGMVPLANHFTRDVKRVTEGAERIAQGDLQTRLPVKSKDEFGQLALAFNRMAEDLSEHQRRLFAEARTRQEQAVQQRVFALDYERKSVELEDARRFQLSMLPKHLPVHDRYDVGVFTKTATEVGGDYYDFHLTDDGVLSITIGDATGHGAKAGTMVTVIKTLFAGYRSTTAPAEFLRDAAGKIKRMDLGRMAMALALARFDRSRVTVASAGMPPLLIHRSQTGEIEEVTLPATPLGTLGMEYAQKVVNLNSGDTVLLMTDGWPELQNAQGLQLGYPNAAKEFADATQAADATAVVQHLANAVQKWHGDAPPNDDITFVVVRVR